MDLVTTLSKIKDNPKNQFRKGVTVDEIVLLEKELGVDLPNSYKLFLQIIGWCCIEHFELYGAGNDVSNRHNLLKEISSERNDFQPPLEKHLIPFMNDGGGNLYCLDTSRMNQGECPIIFRDHETNSKKEVSSHFGEWFIHTTKDLATF